MEEYKEEPQLALQELESIELNYTDEEFSDLARTSPLGKEVSEDAFIRTARLVAENPDKNYTPNIGTLKRILERASIQGSPKKELFEKIVKELEEIADSLRA